MNDIKLTSNLEDKWDWTFVNGDIYNVSGIDATLNNFIHIILLQNEELIQYLYENKGNPSYNYRNANSIDNNIMRIEEITAQELEKHEDVETADITAEYLNNNIYFSGVVHLIDGREVELNGI